MRDLRSIVRRWPSAALSTAGTRHTTRREVSRTSPLGRNLTCRYHQSEARHVWSVPTSPVCSCRLARALHRGLIHRKNPPRLTDTTAVSESGRGYPTVPLDGKDLSVVSTPAYRPSVQHRAFDRPRTPFVRPPLHTPYDVLSGSTPSGKDQTPQKGTGPSQRFASHT